MRPGEQIAGESSIERDGPVDVGADSYSTEFTTGTPVRPEPPHPLLTVPDFGTSVGAAMLGFEQALRSQPPPEIQAAEHRPIRGLAGQGDDLVLLFPDDPGAEAEDDPGTAD